MINEQICSNDGEEKQRRPQNDDSGSNASEEKCKQGEMGKKTCKRHGIKMSVVPYCVSEVCRLCMKDARDRWRKNNRAKERVYALMYYYERGGREIRQEREKSNPEIYRQRKSKYALKNREAIYKKSAEWRDKNREKWREYGARRRAVKNGTCCKNSKEIIKWESGWRKKRKVRCYWCRAMFSVLKCHTDHVIPIAKGGNHEIANVCISCSHCNHSKCARDLSDWNRSLLQPALL